ncbi:MAG: S24 family peptidase [Arcobacter sp.]|nr:S24 family peptidase [Arcobacter sp.]
MNTIKLEYTDIYDNEKTKELIFSKNLIKKDFNESSLFALIIDGKSMQALIQDRSVIVTDLSNKTLEDEGIYLLYYENKMWVKKYNIKDETFVSINPDFSHLVYKKNEIHLVAKVLLTFTNL